MPTSVTQLQQWLLEPEGQRLEFKEAKQRYDFEKLLKYCVALANEGGGSMVLGVTGTATASQLQFIEEIVQHLTEHGAMPAVRLYESPFTDIHVHGPDGVFESAKVELLLKTLEQLHPQQEAA